MPDSPHWPVAGVSMCVVRDGRVLLVKRGKWAGYGLWSLPGGKVEPGERLRDAAHRELYEETTVQAEIVRLLDVIDIIQRAHDGSLQVHYLVSVFAGRWISGEAQARDDAIDARWCALEELDGLKMTPGTADLIRAAMADGI